MVGWLFGCVFVCLFVRVFVCLCGCFFVSWFLWNLLPLELVHAKNVSTFQGLLTSGSKRACFDNKERWETIVATFGIPYTLLVHYCF